VGADIPALFVETYFRASASCSSIWFCMCFSRLFNISSCPRRPKIAFFGASFLAWPPPNQPRPQPDMIMVVLKVTGQYSCEASGATGLEVGNQVGGWRGWR